MKSHRTNLIPLLLVTFTLITLSIPGYAQIENSSGRKFGISAALQTEQLDLLLPIWTSPSFVVVPAISFAYVSDVATEFGLGLGLRMNFRDGDAVPYLGVRGAMIVLNPDNSDSINDVILGPFVGGEYFISDHFSFSVEAQVNVALSDNTSQRFGNPDGTNVNTATLALASFYF